MTELKPDSIGPDGIQSRKSELAGQIMELQRGDHLCLFYERDPAEQIPALVPFIGDALSHDEQFIYVADDKSADELADRLEHIGVNVGLETERGRLKLWMRGEWGQPGALDSNLKALQVRHFIQQAAVDGFKGVRFAMDMTWTLGLDINASEVEHWEATLNTLLDANFPGKIICQYNRSRLAPEVMLTVLHTHPLAMLGDEVCPNPFYQAPLILNGHPNGHGNGHGNGKAARARVDWANSQIKRARAAQNEREQLIRHQTALSEAERSRARVESGELRWRTIFNSSPDCVEIVAPDGTLLEMNDSGLKMIGANSREEVVGRPVYDLVAPGYATALRALHQRVCAGSTETLEFEIVGLNGVRRWVSIRAAPLPNSRNGSVNLLGVMRDITDQKGARDALRVNEERFRLAAQTDALTLYEQDADLRYTWLYPAHPEHAAAAGKTDSDLLPPDEAAQLTAIKRQVMETGVAQRREVRACLPSGIRYYDLHVSPKRNGSGAIIGVAGAALDVTESRRLNEANRQQVRRQSLVADFGRRALAEADLDSLLNEAAELVVRELKTDYCKVLELMPREDHLLLRAGAGWPDRFVGHKTVDTGLDSQAGYTLRSNHPVIVTDLRTENRFRGPSLLRECGVVSGLSVIIHGRLKPFGVLGAHTRTRRDFNENDVNFFQSIANILAAAIDRKQSEQTAQRLAAIVESSDDAIVSKDLDGVIQSWNQGAERIFGYTSDEVIGKPVTILIPPERWDEEPGILRRLRRGERIDHYETVRQRKDGTLVDISLTVSPVKDAGGKVMGASKIARDITERKRIEREQQALYDLVAAANRAAALPDIYRAALDAIQRCHNADRASILLYENDSVMRFKAWRGLSDEYRRAVEGHSPWKPGDANPQPVCIDDVGKVALEPRLRDVIEREGIRSLAFVPIRYEKRLLGKFMIYYNAPHYFTPEEIRPTETIATQIAFSLERRRSGEALERLVQQRTGSLREAIAQMEEFSYSVSHDLRSPVRAMQGYARAVLEDYGTRLDDTGRNYLERIVRGGARMDRLIQDILTYSRLSRREIQLQPVPLDKLVREILHQYPEMQSAHVEIVIRGKLAAVMGHEASLSQAISNLLNNAIKFVPAGTFPKVQLWTETRDGQVRLWVEDNGIGIKPEHQHRLFGMFERIHPESKYEGTGIGLAIVRKAVERMGGGAGLESDGLTGSRFWIQLPAATVA